MKAKIKIEAPMKILYHAAFINNVGGEYSVTNDKEKCLVNVSIGVHRRILKRAVLNLIMN